MRQGITTRYLGATNSHGARVKAIARKRSSLGKEMSITHNWGYENADVEHTAAAKALAKSLGWSGLWIAGGKPEEDGNIYVNVPNAFRCMAIQEPADEQRLGKEDVDWFYVEYPKVPE